MKHPMIALMTLAAVTGAAGLTQAATIGPVSRVEVTASEELKSKTKVLSDRDIADLTRDLKTSVERRLARTGAMGDRGGVLRLTLTEAKPTRPTFTQLSSNVSLSFRSFSLGGMALDGTYTAPDGTVTPISFHYEPPSIAEAPYGWTWKDAEDGFNRFAYSLTTG